jgi:hypothetical protein
VFSGMNSDTLDLGEREGGQRVEGTAAAVEFPYRPHASRMQGERAA